MCEQKQLAAQKWGHRRDAGKALPLLDTSMLPRWPPGLLELGREFSPS